MPAKSTFLAENIRRLRTERGLTAADLAARSGLGKATLSQIEAGNGNPRLETLEALALALGVELTELLADADLGGVRIVRSHEGIDVSSTSKPVARLVTTISMTAAVVEVYDLTIPAGYRQTSVSHGVGAEEHVFVLAGSVLIGPVEAPAEVFAADFASYPADRPHTWVGTGESAARVLVLQVMPRPTLIG
jgi:transcriptional regulator with XRE-family HTH domain